MTTCTTPFVKGKIVVIVKAKSFFCFQRTIHSNYPLQYVIQPIKHKTEYKTFLVKAKSVGATKQKLRQLNALDSRWLLVVRNKSGVMSGQFYHRYLYPHGIRPMFRAARERFRQHKRLRSMVPPSAVLLEEMERPC